MREEMKIAGRVAAHAVWSISDGEVLIPIYQHNASDPAESRMLRIATEDGAERGLEWLEKNEHESESAVFIHDGFAPFEGERTDSLIIQVRRFAEPSWRLQLSIPYRTCDSPTGFETLRPQLLGREGVDSEAIPAAMDGFFDGIEEHPQGSAIMNGKNPGESAEASPGEREGAMLAIQRCSKAPAVVLLLVAGADGTIEPKEMKAFKQQMIKSAQSGVSLLEGIVAASVQTFESTVTEFSSPDADPVGFLRETGELLDAHIAEGSQPLKSWLLSLGVAVASANAKGFFGKKLRDEERRALEVIAAALKVEA